MVPPPPFVDVPDEELVWRVDDLNWLLIGWHSDAVAYFEYATHLLVVPLKQLNGPFANDDVGRAFIDELSDDPAVLCQGSSKLRCNAARSEDARQLWRIVYEEDAPIVFTARQSVIF